MAASATVARMAVVTYAAPRRPLKALQAREPLSVRVPKAPKHGSLREAESCCQKGSCRAPSCLWRTPTTPHWASHPGRTPSSGLVMNFCAVRASSGSRCCDPRALRQVVLLGALPRRSGRCAGARRRWQAANGRGNREPWPVRRACGVGSSGSTHRRPAAAGPPARRTQGVLPPLPRQQPTWGEPHKSSVPKVALQHGREPRPTRRAGLWPNGSGPPQRPCGVQGLHQAGPRPLRPWQPGPEHQRAATAMALGRAVVRAAGPALPGPLARPAPGRDAGCGSTSWRSPSHPVGRGRQLAHVAGASCTTPRPCAPPPVLGPGPLLQLRGRSPQPRAHGDPLSPARATEEPGGRRAPGVAPSVARGYVARPPRLVGPPAAAAAPPAAPSAPPPGSARGGARRRPGLPRPSRPRTPPAPP
mmetsp:Transcript_66682/g.214823  ORF Transcript_66682/g.214823 Transcript_66682/m.214823 type:complete len:416 (-) Transcript_66682:296-1543(-)